MRRMAVVALLLSWPSSAIAAPDSVPARTGFQMHLATGVRLPFGRATGAPGDTLGARYAWQLPFDVGLGAKVSESLYVGGYFGFGIGAEGSDPRVEAACDDRDNNLDNDISCTAASLWAGVEARHSFRPRARTNPWLGLGLGVELSTQEIHDRVRHRREQTSVSGWVFPRLAAGIDFRPGRVMGVGPLLVVSVGRFTHTKTEVNGTEEFSGPVSDASFHTWMLIGARGVLFP